MVSSTRFSRVEHVARPIDLDRIQSLIKEKGLDPLNSVSQMDCFQGGPLQWAVITEETGYRIYVRFDFTKDRELNYAWKIHFLAIKIADSFDSIRSIDDKKKLKKRRRRKKMEIESRVGPTSISISIVINKRSWKRSYVWCVQVESSSRGTIVFPCNVFNELVSCSNYSAHLHLHRFSDPLLYSI